MLITSLCALIVTLCWTPTQAEHGSMTTHDFSLAAETGNYTCSQLKRWIKIEKHYSNIRKEGFFDELAADCKSNPALQLQFSKYTYQRDDKALLKKAFSRTSSADKCKIHDEYAIMYMSSFSINHNFSHFLHSLLRLFCALLDAQYVVWNKLTEMFDARVDYVIWMDENVKLGPNEMTWMRMMGARIRHVKEECKRGDCLSANKLVYGSGCAKLLPPEKWYGYPGCRANKVGSGLRSCVEWTGIGWNIK